MRISRTGGFFQGFHEPILSEQTCDCHTHFHILSHMFHLFSSKIGWNSERLVVYFFVFCCSCLVAWQVSQPRRVGNPSLRILRRSCRHTCRHEGMAGQNFSQSKWYKTYVHFEWLPIIINGFKDWWWVFPEGFAEFLRMCSVRNEKGLVETLNDILFACCRLYLRSCLVSKRVLC